MDSKPMSSYDLHTFLGQKTGIQASYDSMIVSLRRKQLVGGHACAKATIEILRSVLGQLKYSSTDQMMRVVKAIGHGLMAAAPTELTIGNIVRRILHLIREEHTNSIQSVNLSSLPPAVAKALPSREFSGSHSHMMNGGAREGVDLPLPSSIIRSISGDYANDKNALFEHFLPEMRPNLLLAINEYFDEIDSVFGPIGEQALDHIHTGECILTIGGAEGLGNATIELFLKVAAKKRKFQLFVAECAPSLNGHALAAAVAKYSNIAVTVIPDSAIYAVMSRVNKVLLSPLAIMADGGCITHAGHLMVATAAKECAVPVVCISTTYMLTPLFAHSQDQLLSQLRSPADVLPYNASYQSEVTEVILPAFDYIPPTSINLHITNNGAHQPSYLYRLLSEYYHPLDYEF